MAATERTPLTRPNDPPTYIEFAGLLNTRRTKLRQFQCCVCAGLLAIFIMAMVVTIAYSINEVNPLTGDTTNPEEVPPSLPLTLTESPSSPILKISNDASAEASSTSLTTDEWNEAIEAGNKAIASREEADALATPLPAPSPDSRHQFAVKTSLHAGKLALAGIGELAATRSVEESRLKLGASSSMGSYFKNIWIPEGTCKEFLKSTCSPSKYRNFDGTCNHPKNFGAALTPFIRKLPPSYADSVEAPRAGKFGKRLPSAREISLKVHPPSPSSNPSFTVMLAVFGQFLDHDITATAISQGTNGSSLSCCPADTREHPECFPVEVGPGDPVYDVAGRNCMEFVRSAPAPQCRIGPRQQLNQVTAFIDGSVIYGPDRPTSQTLREGQGGQLRMFKTPDNRTLLPQSTNPNDGCNRAAESARGRYCFASGDGRSNENLHLTTMHLLWARQHNKLASELADVNPFWDDEILYQEARRIIGAQLQHITYNEFVPVVLGEKETNSKKLRPLPKGFRPRNNSIQVNPAIANSFAASAFRFAHTLLPGLMKVTDAQKDTSSYVELHRMLFNPYSLYNKGGMESSLKTATSNTIQQTTTHVSSQLTKHLFEDPIGNVTIPCGLDLVSLNIQRGRDHGLPGYNAWRQYCGLGKVSSFVELQGSMDPATLSEITKIYDDVDDVDLYTGALAESDKSDGLVGPTFRCLISDQFARIQQGDRYWYEVPGEPQSFTEDQLKEIRKTSLAKLICDVSDDINEIQPLVMRSLNSDNPMTSCEDIPGPDLTAWKDSSSPVLTAAASADIPETWLNFKTEINKTVQEIVDFFGKTPPAPGSPDWVNFRNYLNNSFSDIRNEVTNLHPKPAEATPSSNPDDKKEFFKQFFKPTGAGFDKGGKFNYMQFVMNQSLTDLNKYSKTATNQSTTYEDWMNFKDEIKKILSDALVNVTGSPTAEQREELKKQIALEIQDIKNGIISVKAAKLYLASESAADDAYWMNFKSDVAKAVTDAVDRIKNMAPAPGDPTWATFGPEIKKQFVAIKNYIPVLPAKKLMAKDPTAAAYWDNFRESLNKSINNAVAGIEGNMPGSDDPAWIEFGAMIKNEFSEFKKNPTLQAKEPKPKDPAIAAFWNDFKTSLNKSINDAVTDIASKSPPPGDPAWAAFGAKIMNDFAGFKDKFSTSKNPLLQSKDSAKDPAIEAFWDDFKVSINKSISDAVADIAAESPPPGDPAWATFGARIMNNFAGFKDKFVPLHVKPVEKIEEKAAGKNGAFDWFKFKSDIINSVSDTVSTIKKNMPPPGSPAWATFRDQIMNGFAKIPSEIPSQKLTATNGPPAKGSKSSKKGAFDWVSFKSDINKSISEIIDKNQVPTDLPPGDPGWAEYGAKFAKFNRTFEIIKTEIDTLRPKAEEAQFSILAKDWTDFKDKINKSLADAVDIIKSKAPASGDPGWASFRDSIKDEFAALKNEISFVKSEATLKTVRYLPNESASNLQEAKIPKKGEVPDFSSDLFSLQKKTNDTLAKLKQSIVEMKLGATAPVISAADWIAFKQDINDAVAEYVKAFNGTQVEEWKEMKDYVKKSFADLRNEIISLRNQTVELEKTTAIKSARIIEGLQAKKSQIPTNNETLFDWVKFKSDVNSTIQNLLDDLSKIVPGKMQTKNLKDSLMKAQGKFVNLELSLSLKTQEELPPDWAVFVNGINKTLNGIMKKIDVLKPVDKADLVAMETYEKEVNEFLDEVKEVVEEKKSAFAAATSSASLLLGVANNISKIFAYIWIVHRIS